MIKKISQLDALTSYVNIDGLKNDSNLSSMLLEVSYLTRKPTTPTDADEVEYYNSYTIDFLDFKSIIGLSAIIEMIKTLSCVSGDFVIGTPGSPNDDRLTADGHKYHPHPTHGLSCYNKATFENDITFHGETQFHNNVKISCDDADKASSDHPMLEVEGTSKFNQIIYGTALKAMWADVAEYYDADQDLSPGTIVAFGGENEITIAKEKANGVVAEKPAFVLNDGNVNSMAHPTLITIAGRTPIRVKGKVKKFDNIILSKIDPGVGVVYNYAPYYEVVGKALESNDSEDEKLVLCTTRLNVM